MTEHNHHRGTRGRRGFAHGLGSWGGLPRGQGKAWQRIAHHKRRALERSLLIKHKAEALLDKVIRHIRWDYW